MEIVIVFLCQILILLFLIKKSNKKSNLVPTNDWNNPGNAIDSFFSLRTVGL